MTNLHERYPRAWIHKSVVIEGDVEIGDGSKIGPNCVLIGPLRVGANCQFSAGCVIGTEPEHRTRSAAGSVFIGESTILRENCVVHRGTGGRDTTIGSNCYIMNRVYIAHDCLVCDGATLSGGVSLGGHATILDGANIGMNAAIHQFVTVGAYSMIGMSTPITRDVPPFSVVVGSPARLLRVNTHASEKFGLTDEDLRLVEGRIVYSQSVAVDEAIEIFRKYSTREHLFEVSSRALISKPR